MTFHEYNTAQQRYRDLLRPLQEQLARDLAETDADDRTAWNWRARGLRVVNEARVWIDLWSEGGVGLMDVNPAAESDPNTTDTP